jgi:L-arabinose isomerase
MIVNEVEVVKCPDMPNLPVASVLWKPLPDLKTGAAAWILPEEPIIQVSALQLILNTLKILPE